MIRFFVDVDTVPVSWREAGSHRNELVLFLHGLGGSRTAWDRQLGALSDERWCVAWDMPGYGASPLPPDGLTFPELADAAALLVGRLHRPAAHVVGLSMGGMIALHLALRRPSVVTTLTLLDTSPCFGFDGTTTPAAWKAARLAPLDVGENPASMAERVLRGIMGPKVSDESVHEGVAAMARVSRAGLRAAVECLVTHDVRDRLRDIELPTTVAVGELDEDTPPSYAEHLAATIPNARLEVIPGVGHYSTLEAPDAVNALLRRSFGTKR